VRIAEEYYRGMIKRNKSKKGRDLSAAVEEWAADYSVDDLMPIYLKESSAKHSLAGRPTAGTYRRQGLWDALFAKGLGEKELGRR